VRVTVDRPGFITNPTSCLQKRVAATVASTAGSVASLASRFQVGECAALSLKPRMRLKVGGKGRTRFGVTTPLVATLSQTRGQSNLKSVSVTLPSTINSRLEVINDACTRAEFDTGHCEQARAGSAVARTPLLKDALRGGAYFVKNGHPLPDLMVGLRGQVDFDLVGRIEIPGGTRLQTTFSAPDVPITSFGLRLNAGKRGSIGNATNLCAAKARRALARIEFTAQNGKTRLVEQPLTIGGCNTTSKTSKTGKTSTNSKASQSGGAGGR